MVFSGVKRHDATASIIPGQSAPIRASPRQPEQSDAIQNIGLQLAGFRGIVGNRETPVVYCEPGKTPCGTLSSLRMARDTGQ